MNCKEEFIKHIEGLNIICASVFRVSGDDWRHKGNWYLKRGHSEEDFWYFMGSLDFEYDTDLGYQEIQGTIWYDDGTWSKRVSNDGYEYWEWYHAPSIPHYLLE